MFREFVIREVVVREFVIGIFVIGILVWVVWHKDFVKRWFIIGS